MKIAKDHKNYNKVLAWQQFYGLILAFYFRMFHVHNTPEIVVLTFIYKPKKSFVGKVYDKFMRYIVTSGYIKYFVVFSESEKKRYADYFDVPEAQFVLKPWVMRTKHRKCQLVAPIILSCGREKQP